MNLKDFKESKLKMDQAISKIFNLNERAIDSARKKVALLAKKFVEASIVWYQKNEKRLTESQKSSFLLVSLVKEAEKFLIGRLNKNIPEKKCEFWIILEDKGKMRDLVDLDEYCEKFIEAVEISLIET